METDLRQKFEETFDIDRHYRDGVSYSGKSLYGQSASDAWEGYQAGHAARDAEVAELRAKVEVAEQEKDDAYQLGAQWQEQAFIDMLEALRQIVEGHGQWNNGIWAANIARAAIAKAEGAK